eukprot:scaffold5525_cov242-Prasinococcus_capsulatus_cf.AAC.2
MCSIDGPKVREPACPLEQGCWRPLYKGAQTSMLQHTARPQQRHWWGYQRRMPPRTIEWQLMLVYLTRAADEFMGKNKLRYVPVETAWRRS